jgi:hypothetical protein
MWPFNTVGPWCGIALTVDSSYIHYSRSCRASGYAAQQGDSWTFTNFAALLADFMGDILISGE